MSNMCCDQKFMNKYLLLCFVVGDSGRKAFTTTVDLQFCQNNMHKGCMQVPDVMHVPWRTKYGHKDSCHHNKFYKT